MRKVLGVFTHPDDEVIFGWPFFQDKRLERYLIMCSWEAPKPRGGGDLHFERRKNAIADLCHSEGITLRQLDMSKDFHHFGYQTAARQLQFAIEIAIAEIHPDIIGTHSPYGEYGHPSHKMCFQIVLHTPGVNNIWVTDCVRRYMYYHFDGKIPEHWKKYIYTEENHRGEIYCCRDFVERARYIYEKRWKCPNFFVNPTKKVALYEIGLEQIKELRKLCKNPEEWCSIPKV